MVVPSKEGIQASPVQAWASFQEGFCRGQVHHRVIADSPPLHVYGIQAAKLGVSIEGATLYCTHQPCIICAKMIVNSGIGRIVYEKGYPDAFSLEIIAESGVQIERFTEDDWNL